MKKLTLTIVLTFIVVLGWAQSSDKYVVILSMDGFRWDLADKANIPTLDSIKAAGSYAEIYPCFPANTFPNHYSMATGLHPDHHGIVNNTFYDKALDKSFSIGNKEAVSDPDFWGDEPIWNTVERQGLLANIYMWVGSEAPVNGRYATVWTPYSSEPSFYECADWVINALHRPVAEIPNLIMWYFEEPDSIEHCHSSDSAETTAMVEKINSVLKYFMDGVKSSPVFDKVNFIFTSDHGMATTSPERYTNLYPLLDNSRIKGAITGQPLYLECDEDYLDEAYEIISQVPRLSVYKRDLMPANFHYGTNKDRITNLIVLPVTGWIVDYREIERERRPGGSHGFNPFDRDMSMVFYGLGPAFKKGFRQKPFQNLNLYVLAAYLLGVEPAPNDGDIENVKEMLTY